MSNILITGVSSGIGRALAKRLITNGHQIWGVARRKKLLDNLTKEIGGNNHSFFTPMDVAGAGNWPKLIKKMSDNKFIPEMVIFNAAVLKNDLTPEFSTKTTQEIFAVNFFSIMVGVEYLLKFVKLGTQFIAISSLSAFKGSGVEGVGYPGSKAALSIAFESLHQKYNGQHHFKTVYFGPVASGMGPFKKIWPVVLSEEKAVGTIIKAMEGKQIIHYSPRVLFLILKLMKIMPPSLYFCTLSLIERFHLKLAKSQKL